MSDINNRKNTIDHRKDDGKIEMNDDLEKVLDENEGKTTSVKCDVVSVNVRDESVVIQY